MPHNKGAVRITLHSNNADVDEKAEVTVALANPEDAVDKMIKTLAQRFPPESVVTIAASRGTPGALSPVTASGSSSDGNGGRSTSYSSGGSDRSGGSLLVRLSPEIREGMAGLAPELTGWILANDPAVLPGLLQLAMEGGNIPKFAHRMGLRPGPVQTIVTHLSEDSDFFDWVSKLTTTTVKPKAAKVTETSVPTSMPERILPPGGSQSSPARRPKASTASGESGHRGPISATDGVASLHPASPPSRASTKPAPTATPPSPIARAPSTAASQRSWLLSPDGRLVAHANANGQPVMHPQRAFPPGSGESTGIPGILLINRDPAQPDLGGPWLVNDEGLVIGHFDPEGKPVLHPNFKARFDQPLPSTIPGRNLISMDPERPQEGSWLIDQEGNIVGHLDSDGTVVMHPSEPLVPETPSVLPGINVAQRQIDLGGPWLVDDQGLIIGHWDKDGLLVVHPPRLDKPTTSWDLGPPHRGSPAPSPPSVMIPHPGSSQTQEPSHPDHAAGYKDESAVPTYSPPSEVNLRSPSEILPPNERIIYEPDGSRTRIIEVPIEEYEIKEIPGPREIREVERRVTEKQIVEVEKLVEVPEIEWKIIEEPGDEVEELVLVEKKVKSVREVPFEVEKIVKVVKIVDKEVEVPVPEIIHRNVPYQVERKETVPRYVNREQATVVAQKLRPIIRQSDDVKTIEAKTYEPILYAVDVFIPKPVGTQFVPLGKTHEVHNTVEIPAAQYNSLLKAMNRDRPEEALVDLYVRGIGGTVPMLPVGELAEVIPPLPGAFTTTQRNADPPNAASAPPAPSRHHHRSATRRRRHHRERSSPSPTSRHHRHSSSRRRR